MTMLSPESIGVVILKRQINNIKEKETPSTLKYIIRKLE